MAKTKLKRDYSDDLATVTFTEVESGNVLAVNLADYSADIRAQLACHGLIQKGGDTFDTQEGWESLLSVHERLLTGDWSKAREGVGPRPTDVAEAVCRILDESGATYDRKAKITAYTGDGSKAMRDKALAMEVNGVFPVKEMVKRIRAERAMAEADKSAAAVKAAGASLSL